MHRHREGAEI